MKRYRRFLWVLLAVFIGLSTWSVVPFCSFLRNGGWGLLCQIDQSSLSIDWAVLDSSFWNASVSGRDSAYGFDLLWGNFARLDDRYVTGARGVIEIDPEYPGPRLRVVTDQYVIHLMSFNQTEKPEEMRTFSNNLWLTGNRGKLPYWRRLSLYWQAADYVQPDLKQVFAFANTQDPNNLIAIPVVLGQEVMQAALRWQLPLIAILPYFTSPILCWLWIGMLAGTSAYLFAPIYFRDLWNSVQARIKTETRH